MSRRVRPGRSPWPEMSRAIRRDVPPESSGREEALQLCGELVQWTLRQSPAPAVSDAPEIARRQRASRLPCWELGRRIGERCRSGDLGPEEALHLFDELLPKATHASIYALNQLLGVIARAPESSSVRDGPALAISCFNHMAQVGVQKVAPDAYTYGILISSCCDVGRLDLGFAAFGKILKTGWRMNVIHFNGLLNGLCAEGRISEAMDIVLRQMQKLGCTPDVFTYTILLKGLCHEKKSQEALELLHVMTDDVSKCNCRPDVVSYSTVIDGFLKEGDVGKAYSIFCEMLDRGIHPNVVTYNSVIDGLCKVQAMDKAEKVLGYMLVRGIAPDSFTHNSMLHGYLTSGQLKEAVNMVKKMPSNGLIPDLVTYNLLIDNLCKNGMYEEARKMFDSMVQNGPKPDVATYGCLLHGYGTKGAFDEMNDLIDVMVGSGVQPNHHIFNIQISTYAKWGMVDEAMLRFGKMQEQGLDPNVVSYRAVIDGLCRAGRPDDAMFQFNQMIDQGLSPDSIVLATLIHGYYTCGKREKAEELFNGLVERGSPYTRVFNVMIDNLCKDGRIMEAQNLYDKMVSAGAKHDVSSYSAMIHGYFLAGNIDKALKLLDDMVLNNLKPDCACTMLINGCCKTGRVQDALTLSSQIQSTGVMLDTITYQVIWQMLFQAVATAAGQLQRNYQDN